MLRYYGRMRRGAESAEGLVPGWKKNKTGRWEDGLYVLKQTGKEREKKICRGRRGNSYMEGQARKPLAHSHFSLWALSVVGGV
jgi:hypothetical protein